MKSYKEAEKIFIGESDIAALVLVGCKGDKGVVPEMLHFVEDGEYSAYLVTLKLESTTKKWLPLITG